MYAILEKKVESKHKKNNVWILAVCICLFGSYLYFNNKDYTSNFNLPIYQSNQDQDKDGIEDQKDLLLGAKAYVATRPKYKSVYYASGYPDDGYEVCTDVVARAMLAAGYDLKILVSNDILQHPTHYGKDVGDANIDFRRVRNLLVYFTHHAIVLTIEITWRSEMITDKEKKLCKFILKRFKKELKKYVSTHTELSGDQIVEEYENLFYQNINAADM